MGRFVPRPGAEIEVRALLDPVLRNLGARVERKAKVKLREAKIRDSGTLERSVKAEPVQASISSSMVVVRSVRFNPEDGTDVAMVIHQGHKRILPIKGRMVFQNKNGQWATITKGGLNSKGEKTNQGYVRAVGGVPFLTESLKEAAREIRAETRGKVNFNVIVVKTKTANPPALISRARPSGRRR